MVVLSCGTRTRPSIDERVDVKDAPTHLTATVLTIDGGKIRFDNGGRWEKDCSSVSLSKGQSCTYTYFYAFPLVPADWTPSDPVPAWVSCGRTLGKSHIGSHDPSKEETFEKCEARLRAHTGDVHGPVRVRVEKATNGRTADSTAGWVLAIQDAEKRHGLVAASNSPVIEVVD